MKFCLCNWVGFVTLACLIVPAQADEAADKANAEQVDGLFAAWDHPDSPGCALGIVRDGKLIVARGYGMANLDHDVPITARSVFEVGSMTKSFTCVCLAILMDRGQLSPDDDLRAYIPEMPRYDPPITIRNLIRCEDGLRDYWHAMPLAGWNIDDAWTDRDVLAIVSLQSAPAFKPGARFAYGSSGYFLLGLAVERITGQSLARFAEENLFQPLEMTDTYLEVNPAKVTKNRVVGYNVNPAGGVRRWTMNSNTFGAWGLKTTVEDLFKWDQNFYANRLPNGPALREFLKTGTLLANRNVLDVQPIERYRGLPRMAFTVGMPGFSAALLRFPEQKFSVICLSNDNWRLAPWKHALRIADYYLSDQMPDAKPPESAAQKYEYVESAERDLNDKVGAYRMRNTRMVWRVSVLDGKLAVTDHLSATYRWQAIGPQRFRATEGPSKDASTLVFERGAENLFEMRLEGDDGSKIDFESIALVEPNAQRLNDYAGRYYCPELAATYSFSVREGRLFLQVHNRRHERLSPTVADEFMPHLRSSDDGRIITFVRDADRKIVGFKIELWSIKDMTFEKLAEAAN